MIDAQDLMAMLAKIPPKTKIVVRLDGSIYPTDNVDEFRDYNEYCDEDGEFCILALENWKDV